MQLLRALLSPSSKNEKSKLPVKIFYIFSKRYFLTFQEMDLSSIFLKMFFLYFQKYLSLSLRTQNFFYKKISFKSIFPNSKNKIKNTLKKFLIFWSTKMFSSKLKRLLIFQERTCKAWKSNFLYFFSYKSNRKKFILLSLNNSANYSKLKYYFIIIITHFLSFCNIFLHYSTSFCFSSSERSFWHSQPYCHSFSFSVLERFWYLSWVFL